MSAAMYLRTPASATGNPQIPPLSRDNSSDSLVQLARAALAQGRYWRATEILSPVMENDSLRTPEAAFVAARAASGWGGWREVERILNRETWLDSLYSGEGRALLARAQIGLENDSAAVENARIALSLALSEDERARRLVLMGRAQTMISDAPGASASYLEAARIIPQAADWLRLRAAAWIADSTVRRELLAILTLPHAVELLARTDALASENTGDTLGAIERYTRIGNMEAVFRLRLALLMVAADSAALRQDIMAALAQSPGAGSARAYVALFDSAFTSESAEENLGIARALGAAGGSRTAASYEIALRGGVGTDSDRFQFATILARLGRNTDAIGEFARVRTPRALAAAAAYQRARTMLRTSKPEEWRSALRAVVRDYPSDTSAATALYLLADLATDEGRDEDARDAFLSAARRFPAGSRAPASLFNAAMIAYVLGDYSSAAREFAAIGSRYPRSGEATPATYWQGRALEKTGDAAAVAQSCARIRTADSLSYYASLCEARNHAAFRLPDAAVPDTFRTLPGIDSVASRVTLLRQLELDAEVGMELDRIRTLAGNDPEQLLSAAHTLRTLGYGARAISLAQQAQASGAVRDARLFRLLYPDTYVDLVGVEAGQYALDVDMLAGLIRQESLFNPSATSPAGARGLMQVMPEVGGTLAREFGFPVWDPVLLWQPDVNARLGVRHFADLVRSQQHIYHVLAAYNAGASRVERWLAKGGTDDPEVFVERIPFVETRDYVRIVSRNREIYRALYRR
jgi:soluble lytic murein transglycosylase